jgi:spore germination protein GerM
MRTLESVKRRRRVRLLLAGGILFGVGLALFVANSFDIGKESSSDRSKIRTAIPVKEATTRDVHIYFAAGSGHYLQAEERKVEAADPVSAAEALILALLQGPENPQLVSPIPQGTKLRHVFLTEDGTAFVDFTPELSRLHPGGVTTERLTLYAIVNTLALNLDQVERVQILLEGEPAPTLAGHLDIRHAMTADLLLIR